MTLLIKIVANNKKLRVYPNFHMFY